MVDFVEVQFPSNISLGARGGPRFNTVVTDEGSGYDRAVQRWDESLGSWDVRHGVRSYNDMQTLIAFFRGVRGRATGFRYKDWTDYILVRQSIGDGTGAQVLYQLIKTYTYSTIPSYSRTITKPVDDANFMVWVDTVLQTQGVDYTVDFTTGVIDFTVGGAPGAGTDNIEAACLFDVPARLRSDEMQIDADFHNSMSWNSIMIDEIRV